MKKRYLRIVRRMYRALRHPRLRHRDWWQALTHALFERRLWMPCRDTVATGLAIGMFFAAVIPGFPFALAVACGIIGMLLVAARDGWISLFIAAAVYGDIGLLPYLCVIILPAWLLVSRAPELRVIPKKPAAEPRADADAASPPRPAEGA